MSDNPVREVAEGIYQIRLPLPFALNHVNCYLLRDGAGWTLLDTGLNTAPAQAAWQAAFDTLHITPADIQRMILTHVHPDHYGMAGWFYEQNHAPILLSPRERDLARLLWGGEGLLATAFDAYLHRCGMPAEQIPAVMEGLVFTAERTFPHPPVLDTLQAGDSLRVGQRVLRVLSAPGHSDGQLIFYDADDQLMLSGDHVLMHITPNIGLWPDNEPNPLGRYLQSLEALDAYPVRLALPGHKTLIQDWHGRLAELRAHHAARLQHTQMAVGAGATVYTTSLQVFQSQRFSPHEWRFAMAETLAHLEVLQNRGSIQQRETDEGRWWFSPV
jgi:glyoxylase-like metal-dependent hydrolase (beta-lactamase superfamily II)